VDPEGGKEGKEGVVRLVSVGSRNDGVEWKNDVGSLVVALGLGWSGE
jgi:hypothetical protein